MLETRACAISQSFSRAIFSSSLVEESSVGFCQITAVRVVDHGFQICNRQLAADYRNFSVMETASCNNYAPHRTKRRSDHEPAE